MSICEPPDMGLGMELGFFARTVCALNPCPTFKEHFLLPRQVVHAFNTSTGEAEAGGAL